MCVYRRQNNDPRTADLRSLVAHCNASGYDGIEMSVGDIKGTFYPTGTPISQVIAEAKASAPRGFFTGGTYHILDGNDSPYAGLPNTDPNRSTLDWNHPRYWQDLRAALEADVEIGAHCDDSSIEIDDSSLEHDESSLENVDSSLENDVCDRCNLPDLSAAAAHEHRRRVQER